MKQTGWLVAGVVAFGASTSSADLRTGALPQNVKLEMGGAEVGFLSKLEPFGYETSAEGPRKGVVAPRPVTFEIPTIAPGVQRLVIDLLDGKSAPAPARITFANMNFKPIEFFELTDLTVYEVALPKLDANNNKVPGLFRISAMPTRVDWKLAGSTDGQLAGTGVRAKPWVPANFSVTITGLEAERVTMVSSITVRKGRAGLEISPFEISVSNPNQGWIDWVKKVLVEGRPDPRDMRVTMLSADLKSTMGSIELRGVHLTGVKHGGNERQRLQTFQLRATSVRFVPASTGATIQPGVRMPNPDRTPTPTPVPTSPTPTLPPRR